MDKILVIDFGGQYTHLIARRIRDLSVYSEIFPYDISIEQIDKLNPKGIVLSGGPSSVYEENAPKLSSELFGYFENHHIPVLGLCYGHHLIGQYYNGHVIPHDKKEYGKALFKPVWTEDIFDGLSFEELVWMSHGDQVDQLPIGFRLLGSTDTCPIAAMGNMEKKIYGLQFHPEVRHTLRGDTIFRNFIFKICNAKAEWKFETWIPEQILEIQKIVGEKNVILGLSGGVDSSVTAVLLQKALKNQVHLIFVNNGLLRKNEVEEICNLFGKELKFKNFHYIEAEQEFLEKLVGISDPEEKRKIIGYTFFNVFERTAKLLETKYPNIEFLAQGTIYPDRVESKSTSKSSAKIKSHHNLTIPETLSLKIIEPLKDLYKDEVRQIGVELGLPRFLIKRHPFPGPGLGVRCLGEITKDRLEILREADAILIDEIRKGDIYDTVWQAFAVLLPVKSVGVMGDFRTYENVCAIRIVESIDAMTANFAKVDWDILERVSTRIINEVKGINRVVYDISNKPPATIEFE